jgi:hypothetical protein
MTSSGDHSLYDSDGGEGFEHGNDNNYDDNASSMLIIWRSLVTKVVASVPNLYVKLLEEAKRELHEGCNTYTRLEFIMKRIYVKTCIFFWRLLNFLRFASLYGI